MTILAFWYSRGMKHIIALVFGVFLCGCSVHAPIVSFTSATITESTPQAIAMEVSFEIANTNDEPVELLMYEYEVTADGSHVYTGKAAALQTIPRFSTVQGLIPIVIRRDQIYSPSTLSWGLQGSLVYIQNDAFAQTLLNAGIWKPTTPLEASGAIEIPRIN